MASEESPASASRVFAAKPDGSVTHNATIFTKEEPRLEVAKITFRRIREEGQLEFKSPPRTYAISHKYKAGQWTVQQGEDPPLLEAHKPMWYRNTLQIKMADKTYELFRPSLKKRDYVVNRIPNDAGVMKKHEERGERVGEVTSDGTFQRNYTLRFDESSDEVLQVFCYWYVSLMNRRSNAAAANANNGGGGAY